MRGRGEIPAELYGHGEPNAHLVLPMLEVQSAIRRGTHLVELKGAVNESALIKEVQWDPFGSIVLHLDLARVSVEETVEVVLHVELRRWGEEDASLTGDACSADEAQARGDSMPCLGFDVVEGTRIADAVEPPEYDY